MSSFKFEAWPTEYRAITQYFGANPQNYAQFKLPGHEGLDIMAPMGSKVFAVAPGQVKVVNSNPIGHNYGIHVRVSHVDGYETIYAHLESASVRPGDRVQAGQELGRADNTGNSFGSHLHLTLKKEGAQFGNWPNNIIDPTPFLLPLLGWRQPAGPYTEGWAYTAGIIVRDELAQASAGGVNLRRTPSVNGDVIDLIPGGTIMIVSGAPRGQYTPVKVPTAALSSPAPPPPPQPAPPPPPTVTTLDGWGWRDYLTVSGDQAVVGEFGINLRAAPDRNATNIGLVRGGSSVTVLGPAGGEYLHVRVRRTDFMNPVDLPAPPPVAAPGSITPPADSILGWAWSAYLEIAGRQGVVGRFGITLRAAPSQSSRGVGLVKGGATVTLVGPARGEYTPVFVRQADALNLSSPMPAIEPPTPFPTSGAPEATAPPPAPEKPIHDTTPGWAFTTQITVMGDTAVAGQYGINLRDAPRRTAVNKGFVPAGAVIIVTGAAQGEYTPVRVPDDVLQAPFGAPPVLDPTSPPEAVNPDPPALGRARIGLHAAADPGISDAELAEFAALRPGVIKVLSFHDPDGVRKLAAAHPDATWVVRAFLDFGGRNITPGQFVQFTLSDVRRTLDILQGRDVVVELHNEPNIAPEGLGAAWSDGRSFASWWLELLRLYRVELPRMRFIYPGLSPGSDVRGFKEDHVRFVEDSRAAVEAADGLAVHLYWSNVYPMESALAVLDDYISRFRYRPIWVTEASNNKSGVTPYHKGLQYLKFWEALQERPLVHGVTYFVASALNPEFAEEVWVGRGIGAVVGRR
jgi:hypothetical protein